MLKRAVFLDRDGTIIADRGDLKDPNGIEILPGAVDALRKLAREGWKLIVIADQPAVGRGEMTKDEMNAVQAKFLRMLRAQGIEIVASYFCTHGPGENCECRKPGTALVERAAKEHSLSAEQSWMIGDREEDILCGRDAGCSTVWLKNAAHPVAGELPDYIAANWTAAYEKISEDSDAAETR
ncbi:MAG: HAD family hydrolase [Acidobacteriota bacterium]|nr:HAD family hydrolase [Acidobacteriota bacterium]